MHVCTSGIVLRSQNGLLSFVYGFVGILACLSVFASVSSEALYLLVAYALEGKRKSAVA